MFYKFRINIVIFKQKSRIYLPGQSINYLQCKIVPAFTSTGQSQLESALRTPARWIACLREMTEMSLGRGTSMPRGRLQERAQHAVPFSVCVGKQPPSSAHRKLLYIISARRPGNRHSGAGPGSRILRWRRRSVPRSGSTAPGSARRWSSDRGYSGSGQDRGRFPPV